MRVKGYLTLDNTLLKALPCQSSKMLACAFAVWASEFGEKRISKIKIKIADIGNFDCVFERVLVFAEKRLLFLYRCQTLVRRIAIYCFAGSGMRNVPVWIPASVTVMSQVSITSTL